MNRSITTLFMLMSVDDKISTGATNNMDMDKDFPNIKGIKEGLHQYYEIEQTTDLWSMTSCKIQAKLGINQKNITSITHKLLVSFVMIDNININKNGILFLCKKLKRLVLVTTNKSHPAYKIKEDNLDIIYQPKLNLENILKELKEAYKCDRITIQTGSTINGLMLRDNLIDYADIVVAPILIGGKCTPSLIGGESLLSNNDLYKLGVLELQNCIVLNNSYLRLQYKVIK